MLRLHHFGTDRYLAAGNIQPWKIDLGTHRRMGCL